ncbi:MAG TPA: hypothetical protein VMM78_00660 [Thermomicrobiales bacterium]|nr:hypothetical protein [Thermomicrobiales bacterium]
MDWDLTAQLATPIGTALAGAVCWWRFSVARARYVPVADSQHAALQDTLNSLCWMTAFVAAFIVIIQPAALVQFAPPSGWAALAGGALGAMSVLLQPMRRLGIWLGTRPPDSDQSEFLALMRRETERIGSDRCVLLVVAPFFAGAAALTASQAGATSGLTFMSYNNGLALGFIHVGAALSAIISWRALGNLQRDMRSGLTDVRIIDVLPETADAPAPASTDVSEKPSDPPFLVRLAQLVYEAVTGGAVGVAFWYAIPRLNEWPVGLVIGSLLVLGILSVVVWRSIRSWWRPSLALGLMFIAGLFGVGGTLVYWAGVTEYVAWSVGFGVCLVMFEVISPADDRGRVWFHTDRARVELVTGVVACGIVVALGSLFSMLLPDTGELLVFSGASVIALVLWIRLPERLMRYAALLIVAFGFGFAPLVALAEAYDLFWLGFVLAGATWVLGGLRQRFGPGGDDLPNPRGIRLNPFTNERRELLTRLSPEECARRVEERTHATLGGKRRTWRHTPEQEAQLPPIEAQASPKALSLAKFRGRRTSIMTVATATLSPTPEGTLIRARSGMHSGFRVLHVIFWGYASFILLGGLVTIRTGSSDWGRFVSGMAILSASFVVVTFIAPRFFDDESRELLDFLTKTLEAEPLYGTNDQSSAILPSSNRRMSTPG